MSDKERVAYYSCIKKIVPGDKVRMYFNAAGSNVSQNITENIKEAIVLATKRISLHIDGISSLFLLLGTNDPSLNFWAMDFGNFRHHHNDLLNHINYGDY